MPRKPICPNALRTAYASGETLKQIADRFDCTDRTVWKHARELGLQHPKAPKRRHEDTEASLVRINAIQRYKDGESLRAIALPVGVSTEGLCSHLRRNGVKIRTRVEGTRATMQKYGTRFHKTETRLYICKRDPYGLVTEVKMYQNKARRPVKIWGQWGQE